MAFVSWRGPVDSLLVAIAGGIYVEGELIGDSHFGGIVAAKLKLFPIGAETGLVADWETLKDQR